MTLHSKLYEVRAERGLTQVQIVAQLKPTFDERGLAITQGMWSAWERGRRPEDEKIAAIEDGLGLEEGELFRCLRDSALSTGSSCLLFLRTTIRRCLYAPAPAVA